MTVQYIYKRFCLIAAVTIGSFLASCGNGAKTEVSKTDTATTKVSEPAEQEEGIELTAEQMEAVGIELGTIELKNLSDVIKASGQLAVPPQRQADVNVLMGGVIKRIYPLEGQWVKKGQVLATIENTELAQIQEEYVTAKNAFSFTAAELKRQQELDEAAAGTKRKLQEAQANYNSERARLGAMEKRLRQLGVNPATVAKGSIATQMNVYAPISGTVGHIGVNTGTYAQPGNSLMEIIDNSQIHCDLVVYEKDLFKVKIGQKVTFMLTNQNNREIVGRIYGINKSFEDESKGIIVHAVIENANTYGLIPGMYVTALVAVGSSQVTAVPIDAVVRSEGRNYIFVVDEEAKEEQGEKGEAKEEEKEPVSEPVRFKMVEVATGVSELGYIKITTLGDEGKNPKVVVKGANYILSKAKGGEEEEH
jgi:membrane fusion protein, heavy metal efflux system